MASCVLRTPLRVQLQYSQCAGYWGESENLDRELSLFVAGMWTCLNNVSSDEPYYYNQVSPILQFQHSM